MAAEKIVTRSEDNEARVAFDLMMHIYNGENGYDRRGKPDYRDYILDLMAASVEATKGFRTVRSK